MVDDKKKTDTTTTATDTTKKDEGIVDAEEFKQDVIEDVEKKVDDKVKEAIPKIKEEATKAAKEDLVKTLVGDEAEEQAPWEKEKRSPRNYKEVADWGKEQAVKEMEAKQEERDDKVEAKTKKDEKQTKDKEEQQGEYWNKQLKKLTEEGHLPEVEESIQKKMDDNEALTQEEQQDPGVQARVNLYKQARDTKESNLELVFHKDIKGKTQQVGATAPVIGVQKGLSGQAKSDYTYEEIQKAKTYAELTG